MTAVVKKIKSGLKQAKKIRFKKLEVSPLQRGFWDKVMKIEDIGERYSGKCLFE